MKSFRLLVSMLCALTMVMSCFTVTSFAGEVKDYDPGAAIEFARANCEPDTLIGKEIEKGKQDCVVFVSACLEAGNIPKAYYKSSLGYSPESYVKYLLDNGLADKYEMTPSGNYYYADDNPMVAPGDVLMYECCKAKSDSHKKIFHLSLVSEINDYGAIRICQHNGAVLDGPTIKLKHSACGSTADQNKIYVLHMKSKDSWKLPSGVKTSYVNAGNKIKISWNSMKGASGYYVYKANSENGTYTRIATTTSSTTYYKYKPSISDSGKTLYFKVAMYKTSSDGKEEGLNGPAVTGSSIKTFAKPSVKKSSSKAVKVTWSGSLYDAAGVQISKSTSSSSSKCKVVKTYTGSNKYTTVSAKKGTKYYYRVRAYKVVSGKKVYGPWSSYTSYKLK